MPRPSPFNPLFLFILVTVTAVLASGCRLDQQGPLEGRASDEWVRSYDVGPGGELQIVGGDGSILVEAGSGPKVEVTAERIGMAPTDEGARELVPRISIREDIAPDRVVLQSEGLGGIVIGVKVLINYRVAVPSGIKVRARTAGGAITLRNLDGQVIVSSANGEITATGLRGGIEARATNNKLTVDVAAVGANPIDLRVTNGLLDLSLPADANANLSLNVTNGKLDVDEMKFEVLGERTPRRVRGRLNEGGTPIELNVVNGSLRLHPRQ